MKTSHYEGYEGIYDDQWLKSRVGGGQELANAGSEKATRLYAGGVIEPEKLALLGITEKQVIGYLQDKIRHLGGKTRLEADCVPEPDRDWQYQYRILNKVYPVGLTMALETIDFKSVQVFVHGFMTSPVKD